MNCKSCKNWSGTCASDWGDCQHVIFDLLPMVYENRFGGLCQAPFDPHDMRYYLSTSAIHTDMKYLPSSLEAELDIFVEFIEEDVMWMDDKGVESVKRVRLPYIKTSRYYSCGRYEEC